LVALRASTRWILPIVGLALLVVALLTVSMLLEGRPFQLGSFSSIQFVLNTNAAALASTLGILMAIVLLMVQLTAQRYSFNIIGMFVHDLRNVALVVLFIATICFNLWLSATLDDGYIPDAGTYLALAMGTVCFGLLLPYFRYLFDTLTPQKLLDTLQREALRAVEGAREPDRTQMARERALTRIQQIGDITRTSASLGDADVAQHSIWNLYGVFGGYLERKPTLPKSWFTVDERFFRGRHELVIRELEETGTWFERRIFEELQSGFNSSLNRLEALNTTISLCCRLAGERALERNDEAALRLLIKFFNTFLRAALNARDARAGYHLLYQYALLAEAALPSEPDLALEIASRIAYYGDTAIGSGVYWMAIAAAQDLRSLVKAATRLGCSEDTIEALHKDLLRLVTSAEARPELRASAPMRLLYKAVIALAAYHLDRNRSESARRLVLRLDKLGGSELGTIVEELEVVVEPVVWELTDRVLNFEYVEPGPRARLRDLTRLFRQANDARTVEQAIRAVEASG
jgi:hypothetical protein